jgi:ADP-heptose:LPS heptosyltransferase
MLGKTKLFQAVRILNNCEFFISNDTCLYHFASGLQKKGLVFWRETSHKVDGNPFDKDFIQHHQSEDITTYKAVVDKFLDR